MSTKRSLCIHGHFYQPPRENPWLEAIEIQDGAFPYHDWNHRITTECYAANTASRILDDEQRILDIVSNYAKISFDIGPTLLLWLQKNSPATYEAIIEADRLSASWRSGHGAAIAQAYNHMIMPLASERDKQTQIKWGIRDFQYRFGRDPEGMWLPETAVDLQTLDMMAAEGIAFTLLAPHQAAKVRKNGAKDWQDVSGARIDPKMPYTCVLPSGRSITLFFYDGPVSRAVAFEGLLNSGEVFARRLLSGFDEGNGESQLMHIATDGESYGHHHRFGEMALSSALDYVESNALARITNYGEFLEHTPPTHEVQIIESTSWSCAHGVERWRSDCGCSTGANTGWDQKWRAPLRTALDGLRDELAVKYEQAASKYFKDPWAARDDYIDFILNRTDEDLQTFLGHHAINEKLERRQRVSAVKLLEIQRHAMLMYTSCGWFFDDVSGIETAQVLQYAGRAVQLAREVLGANLDTDLTASLTDAKSNVPEEGDGAKVYDKMVRPWVVDMGRVAAHYAISSLFEDYPETADIYCYRVHRMDYQKSQAGMAVLVTGHCNISSVITGESSSLSFSVLHLGNHDFNCGVRKFVSKKTYKTMSREINDAFESGAFADVVRLIDKHFGSHRYSHKDLFRDEQRTILDSLIKETMDGFEASYRRMYEDHRILMGFLKDSGIPVPKAFFTAAELILNLDLKRRLLGETDIEAVQELLREFKAWGASMDTVDLEFSLRTALGRKMKGFAADPSDVKALKNIEAAIDAARILPFELSLWQVQNIYYMMAKTMYPGFGDIPAEAEAAAKRNARFRSLGRKLNLNMDHVLPGQDGGGPDET